MFGRELQLVDLMFGSLEEETSPNSNQYALKLINKDLSTVRSLHVYHGESLSPFGKIITNDQYVLVTGLCLGQGTQDIHGYSL